MFTRGFSLYSFQEELFLGQMTVEDCVAFGATIGAHGVELLPEQNMPDFPNISDAKVAAWHDMLAKYHAVPTCYDMFLDTKLRKDRIMTDEEQVESITRDVKLANRLGFKNMRVLVFVRPDILEKCVPVAERYDVHLGVEVHAPGGAMYVFFRLAQAADSLDFCKRMVRDARVGLAPGSAFGADGEGYVRWCYACRPDRLDEGVRRLRDALRA